MRRREGIRRIAEDRFLHGHLLSRWITNYVDLEESLAVGSIAQEELAHAATLLELSGLDLAERDIFIFERSIDEWQPTALVTRWLDEWPATVLRGYLLATVGKVGSGLLRDARDPELRGAGEVMLAEQQLHVTHWERWVKLLAQDDRTRDELMSCATDVFALASDIFGAPAFDETNGVAAHAAWFTSVGHFLSESGLPVTALGDAPSRREPSAESELPEILREVRAERAGVNDGVRGLYR